MTKPHQMPLSGPWYTAIFYSRGTFSPRLCAAWAIQLFVFWLLRRWITWEGATPRPDVAGIVGTLQLAVITLFGLGTVQKTVLGDASPAPGFTEAVAESQTPPTS